MPAQQAALKRGKNVAGVPDCITQKRLFYQRKLANANHHLKHVLNASQIHRAFTC